MAIIEAEARTANRMGFFGQISTFLIAFTAIAGGIYLIANDKDAGGIATIMGSLVALSTAFAVGKYFDRGRDKDAD
jgi:hypothetical protein